MPGRRGLPRLATGWLRAAFIHEPPVACVPVVCHPYRPTMTSLRHRSAAFTVTCLAAVLLQPMVAPAAAQPATGAQQSSGAGRLDLGPADLVETRTVERLQPGVTLTVIRRGAPDPALSWTLEVRIPATAGAPDPAAPPRVLSDLVSAEAEAVRLRAAGLAARRGGGGPTRSRRRPRGPRLPRAGRCVHQPARG